MEEEVEEDVEKMRRGCLFHPFQSVFLVCLWNVR